VNGRELIAALCGQENVIVIRRPFVAWLGHVSDALLLDQVMYWQDRAGDGVWWHQSDEDVCERLCLTLHALYQARNRLAARGLIETSRKGIPARIHYLVHTQAVVDGLSEHVGPNGRTGAANPEDKGRESKEPSIDEGGVEGERQLKATPTSTSTPPKPPASRPAPAPAPAHGAPTVQAGKPGDQVAQRPVPTRRVGSKSQAGEHRSTSRQPTRPAPDGGSQTTNRWLPVATVIMGALGRPAPRGKLPAWLSNAVAAFGAAAGDDPERALILVAGWARSRPLREALERGIVRDHTVPAMVGAWLATGGAPRRQAAPATDPMASRMQQAGAPENWHELVYTRDGTRIASPLVLPRLGLEPYAPEASWPEWYRVFEGVGS